MTNMDIQELIKKVFNENLSISGGIGNSIEEAIVLESAGPMDDYVDLEYQITDLFYMDRDVSWKLKGQELIIKDSRKYDKLTVAVEGINGNPMPLHLEYHYFDITKYIDMLNDIIKRNDK